MLQTLTSRWRRRGAGVTGAPCHRLCCMLESPCSSCDTRFRAQRLWQAQRGAYAESRNHWVFPRDHHPLIFLMQR